MNIIYTRHDDSGVCVFGPRHNFIPIYDEAHFVGICCRYCGYILYEHPGDTLVMPDGTLITVATQKTGERK